MTCGILWTKRRTQLIRRNWNLRKYEKFKKYMKRRQQTKGRMIRKKRLRIVCPRLKGKRMKRGMLLKMRPSKLLTPRWRLFKEWNVSFLFSILFTNLYRETKRFQSSNLSQICWESLHYRKLRATRTEAKRQIESRRQRKLRIRQSNRHDRPERQERECASKD